MCLLSWQRSILFKKESERKMREYTIFDISADTNTCSLSDSSSLLVTRAKCKLEFCLQFHHRRVEAILIYRINLNR